MKLGFPSDPAWTIIPNDKSYQVIRRRCDKVVCPGTYLVSLNDLKKNLKWWVLVKHTASSMARVDSDVKQFINGRLLHINKWYNPSIKCVISLSLLPGNLKKTKLWEGEQISDAAQYRVEILQQVHSTSFTVYRDQACIGRALMTLIVSIPFSTALMMYLFCFAWLFDIHDESNCTNLACLSVGINYWEYFGVWQLRVNSINN